MDSGEVGAMNSGGIRGGLCITLVATIMTRTIDNGQTIIFSRLKHNIFKNYTILQHILLQMWHCISLNDICALRWYDACGS